MIRPAVWVDSSAIGEVTAPDCLICGTKETGWICPDCLNGRSLDNFVTQTGETPFAVVPERVLSFGDQTDLYQACESSLPSPWKEYFRIISISAGRYYVSKGSMQEVVSLCETLLKSSSGIDQYAANRVGGLLLFIRMSRHEYTIADGIAGKLHLRMNIPYQAYYVLADFYMRTRRLGLAADCISRMKSEYGKDTAAVPWIEKISADYNARKTSGRYYRPADKQNQDKLEQFLLTIEHD